MTSILVVGDVINDVIVRPAGATAADSDTKAEITSVPGGSGANQAAWLAELGVPVRLAARVGAADAEDHRRMLAGAGVDPRLSVDPDLPTGSIVVLVGDDGARCMYTDRGANARFDAGDLGLELLDGMAHLHVSGYAFVEAASRAAVASLWQAAGRSGIARSVDGSAAFLSEIGSSFLDWTSGADVIFANRAEAAIISGFDEYDQDRVVARLLQQCPVVALKLGPEGAVVATRAATVVCPPPDGAVVDPTGAGDAFCAGFLADWLDRAALPSACASATRAAAAAVALVGGRPPARPFGSFFAPPWERLRQAARSASASAHAPYSGLRVGAAGVTGDGRIVTGCNVENASFGLTLCAECGLVSALRAAGATVLVAVSVVAADGEPRSPCGRCRQVLLDNGGPGLLIDRGPEARPIRLGELLPEPFGPGGLSPRGAG